MLWLFLLSSAVALSSCDFGLINLLYWKADANLDHIISKAELQTIWHDFDKNADKKVTQAEFVPLWMEVTGHSREVAVAYFLLADLNDDDFIDQTDIDALYKLFDRDHNGQVSPEEFSLEWQRIIRDMPFAVMFEHGDANHDDFLMLEEFKNAFFYLSADTDRHMTEGEFSAQWMAHGFGKSHQAVELFKHLDMTRDHVINDADLTQLFTKFDTSGDHKISLSEFIQMATWVPAVITNRLARTSEIQYEVYLFDAVDIDNSTFLDKSELSILFSIFDANNDSQVTETEFKQEWVTTLKLGSAEQAVTLFKRADANGNGLITFSDLGPIFKYFDQDGDNKVYIGEFLTQWGALKLGPVNPGTTVVG